MASNDASTVVETRKFESNNVCLIVYIRVKLLIQPFTQLINCVQLYIH
jgi:hypothetical protein